MFDIGWTEMLVVAMVAILFVGPKELPGMLRTFGKSVKKIRAMAGDFQQQFDEALKDSELDGIKDTINDVRKLDPTKAIKDKLNPLKDDLDDVKKSVEESTNFDANTLFDESKAPDVGEPVKVDVDAALERQRQKDAEFAKVAPSSGANAVPGFGGPKADPLPVDSPPKVAKTKPVTPKKAVSKTKSTPRTAETKKAVPSKPASAKVPKKATTSKLKPASTKAAAKKPVAKRKPAKKARA